MNATIRELYERKSVRVFEDRPIEEEKKELILTAAAMAPTAGNQQLYTIIDVKDPQKKEMLSELCDHQPFIAAAPMVLIFCADCRKWYDAFCCAGCQPRHPGPGDLMLAVSDANIAAQNAVTAAWSLGIGSCYIGDIMENCEKERKLLCLPSYVFPAAMVVFGYPTDQQRERPKPVRADRKYIVHEDAYRRMEAGELEEMLKGRVTSRDPGEGVTHEDYLHWIKAFCERKYNSEFSREMSRSVAVYGEDFLAR